VLVESSELSSSRTQVTCECSAREFAKPQCDLDGSWSCWTSVSVDQGGVVTYGVDIWIPVFGALISMTYPIILLPRHFAKADGD
jgi:hypothetical protein